MMDTSALVAALVRTHEHHDLTRRWLADVEVVPVIVIAETYSILRRVFGQSARVSVDLLAPWSTPTALLATSADVMATALGRASELDLAGNIHDALIALVCIDADVSMVTLDARQHRIALALGARSTYLLA
jgi:predicted nucleic acid-binding protein